MSGVEAYAEAFLRRGRFTCGPGVVPVEAPGVVGTVGEVDGMAVGRLLVTDDRAAGRLAELAAGRGIDLVSVLDGAPACRELLDAHPGLALADTGAAMVRRDLEGLPEPVLPEGLRVRAVAGAEGVDLDTAIAACLSFDVDSEPVPLHRIRSFLTSLPLARIVVALDRDGAVRATAASGTYGPDAVIVFVSTDPALRGRGIGTAMTATALRAARDCGALGARLDASPAGEPIYRRLGFERVSGVRRYVARGAR